MSVLRDITNGKEKSIKNGKLSSNKSKHEEQQKQKIKWRLDRWNDMKQIGKNGSKSKSGEEIRIKFIISPSQQQFVHKITNKTKIKDMLCIVFGTAAKLMQEKEVKKGVFDELFSLFEERRLELASGVHSLVYTTQDMLEKTIQSAGIKDKSTIYLRESEEEEEEEDEDDDSEELGVSLSSESEEDVSEEIKSRPAAMGRIIIDSSEEDSASEEEASTNPIQKKSLSGNDDDGDHVSEDINNQESDDVVLGSAEMVDGNTLEDEDDVNDDDDNNSIEDPSEEDEDDVNDDNDSIEDLSDEDSSSGGSTEGSCTYIPGDLASVLGSVQQALSSNEEDEQITKDLSDKSEENSLECANPSPLLDESNSDIDCGELVQRTGQLSLGPSTNNEEDNSAMNSSDSDESDSECEELIKKTTNLSLGSSNIDDLTSINLEDEEERSEDSRQSKLSFITDDSSSSDDDSSDYDVSTEKIPKTNKNR